MFAGYSLTTSSGCNFSRSVAAQYTAQYRRGLEILQYKDRVDVELIKPAVDWRKTGVASATATAARQESQ